MFFHDSLILSYDLKIENLPQRIVVREKEIFDKETIAKQFNDYFINIGLA